MNLTRLKVLLFLALLFPILAHADVIIVDKGVFYVGVTTSPIQVISGSYGFVAIVNPGQYKICSFQFSQWTSSPQGFYGSLTPITINTTSGYVIHVNEPMFYVNISRAGTLGMIINQNPYISTAKLTLSTTQVIYPSEGYFSLSTGNYYAYFNATFISPITSPFTLQGRYNYTVQGVTFMYNFYETMTPLNGNVMNLLNGYSNFYVPHIYEGVRGSSVAPYTVTYYSSSSAPSYWGTSSITQPVLNLVPATQDSQGLMFWNDSYTNGENVTITLIGVYTSGTSPVSDGFEIYLFLNPTQWSVSPYWNNSASFPTLESDPQAGTSESPVQGDIALPQSQTSYIMIQWDPYWQIGYSGGSGGQWNVWVVSNPSNSGASVAYANGVGSGYFEPNPGDYILICVTYIPTANTINGIAYDLNTGQYATVSISLGSYFSPPPSGSYVFGIGGNTGGAYANWGLLYANYTVW